MRDVSPQRQRTLQLQERVFRFATGVIDSRPRCDRDPASLELWQQLVRAVTSASNNLEEADEASSSADFVAKMKIAGAWEAVERFADEAGQIAAIFATIILNVKRRLAAEALNRKPGRSKL